MVIQLMYLFHCLFFTSTNGDFMEFIRHGLTPNLRIDVVYIIVGTFMWTKFGGRLGTSLRVRTQCRETYHTSSIFSQPPVCFVLRVCTGQF
jgi:hypothetical protein